MTSELTILCQMCNRPTRKDTVYTTMWLGAQLNVIENVPAHVCDSCGIQHFEPDVEDKLRALSVAGFPEHLSSHQMPVPVFKLEDIDLPAATGAARVVGA